MPWWHRHLGVRARSTLAATLVVALALAAASAALVVLLQRSLVAGIDAAVTTRAEEIADLVPAAGLDRADPGAVEALTVAVAAASAQDSVVQVLAPDGRVMASSEDIDGEAALSPAHPAPGELVRQDRRTPVDDDRFRLVVTAADTDAGVYTVVVGQSLGAVEDSVQAVTALVAVGYPILLVVVGAATSWFVGRSLRPVEAIRAKVAGIGGRELTERVPVPAARDEVARLAVTMNQMLDRLEAAQRSQRQFVADASHELRSPIATLKAAAEIALAHPDQADADPASVAAGTLAETSRLERLVNDLLLLARADERGLHPDRHEVDLDDLLTAEATRLRATTALHVTSRIHAVRVLGDAHQLAQALRNLVDNAGRHATAEVGLTLTRDGAHAVIEVSDDGPGIPQADRERVFDRFVRLDDSRQRARGGSGLGLAIVREIATAHRGTVAVVDGPAGATLRLTLPVHPVDR
ncbi:signal transduction histidine kinase [Georgenia muralis]|uniref:histidine kinase n=1 Tax=Georgenia muralis TaxID=154117 RepID=A0A3N4Z818_9MICO|nr:signal transduction histidine kinase [Georgenia muralis]